jgi:hypothetical protein
MKKIILDLPNDQARALAQFVKRTGFDDCQRLASRYDGGEEAEEMSEAIPRSSNRHSRKAGSPLDSETTRPGPSLGSGFFHPITV